MRCSYGRIFDVVVDLRPGSPTQRNIATFELTDATQRSLYIPAGCAHGFQVPDRASRRQLPDRPGPRSDRGRRDCVRRPRAGYPMAAAARPALVARPGSADPGHVSPISRLTEPSFLILNSAKGVVGRSLQDVAAQRGGSRPAHRLRARRRGSPVDNAAARRLRRGQPHVQIRRLRRRYLGPLGGTADSISFNSDPFRPEQLLQLAGSPLHTRSCRQSLMSRGCMQDVSV